MTKETILIKNGRVVDPANNLDSEIDVLIVNGSIVKIEKNISASPKHTIDAKDKIVMPGLVDMHVHLREPGREDKETVATGTSAALGGGVTTVLAMPNTNPAIDSIENLKLLQDIVKKDALVDVHIAASISRKREGQILTNIAALKKEGAIAITDDGSSIDKEELMAEAFRIASKENILVICHCQDSSLSKEGVVNLGFTSTRLGLRGISKESEYKRVARDIELAGKFKARIHIAHVSCKESVEIIAQARKKGIQVSAETAPHYFSLTDEAVLGFDTNMKINPPLRGKSDREAIRQGLRDGVIDVIASDHAPHTINEKAIEFDRAAFGTIGLETELAVSLSELVHSGLLDWSELVKKISLNPAKILGINKGTLSVGANANVVIVSPTKEWMVRKEELLSKSKNSCFLGKNLKGFVEQTIYNGICS